MGGSINLFSDGFWLLMSHSPVSIAARSKASTVFGSSNIEIACSNPARGMDVYLCLSVLSCVGRGLGCGLIPHPRSPTKCLRDP
jgi:hypothetical protein